MLIGYCEMVEVMVQRFISTMTNYYDKARSNRVACLAVFSLRLKVAFKRRNWYKFKYT